MKSQSFTLGVLAALSIATAAFAGTPAASPKTPQVAAAHTPMTPQQTRALWQSAQTKLKADHLYSGPINGQRNDETMSAIRTFQSRHRLPETGNLDRATREALGI